MKSRKFQNLERWNLLSIPILFVIGSFFHFFYELSGNAAVIGMIAAVNESVWEHQKMALLPVIGWWTIFYLVKGGSYQIDKRKWFAGAACALCTSILTIPLIFYFYSSAFGAHWLIVDVLILLLAVAAGQLLGMHVFKHSNGMPLAMSILIILLIIAAFAVFTFDPPQIPWFRDSLTGRYGIR